MQKVIAITGASGSMGSEALKQIIKSKHNHKVKLILRNKPSNRRLSKALTKRYGDRLAILMGDIVNVEDCREFVRDVDYILHCAAIIPPNSDHYPEMTRLSNFVGTVNLVNAVKESGRMEEIKFVNISTVALYGNRNYLHPWGRVGDPLMPSCFDNYSATKLKAERYLLDSKLPYWVSLRQTAILHKYMLRNNMKDGLMFHTCWNVPFEWVTDRDSGLLLKNLVEFDISGTLDKSFWNRCFNIGGGKDCRCTGYDTFACCLGLMGASTEDFFKPNWNVIRNFHGLWYYDSDDLEKYCKFQTESCEVFWKRMNKRYKHFKLGAIMPKRVLSKLVIQRLFKNTNSPMYWIREGKTAWVNAFYGSEEAYKEIGEDWSKFPILSKGQTAEGDIDYEELKDTSKAKEKGLLLSHGYDEDKPNDKLGIRDMQEAATFRGGKCLSTTMKTGDLYTKLEWECHGGHRFFSSPYTILKAGHWCPECCQPTPWRWGELAKSIPFFAQVWYDSFKEDELHFITTEEENFMSYES